MKKIYLSNFYLDKEIRFYFKKCIILSYKKKIAAKKICKFLKKKIIYKKSKNFLKEKGLSYCLYKVAEGKTMLKELCKKTDKVMNEVNKELNN